jgi:hypothetical protein
MSEVRSSPAEPAAESLVVRSRRGYWLGRGAGALAFASACALSAWRGSGATLAFGLVGLLLFATFAVYALRQLLRSAPRLRLDAGGFEAADLGVGPIPWSDVEHLQVFGSREAPFIAFHVRDPEAYVARMPPWPRMMVRLLAASGLPRFSVNLVGVDQDVGQVAGHARRWLQRDARARR